MEQQNYENGNQNQENEVKLCQVITPKPVCPACETMDKLFAVFYFLLGYGFIFTCSTWDFEGYLAIFTICYVVAVLSYLSEKGVSFSKESWFWLGAILAMGVFYAFWSVWGILQVLALMMVAAYWTLLTANRLLEKNRTSKWVFFDIWNALAVVPFSNFSCQIRVLLSRKEEEERTNTKGKMGAVFLGVVIALPILVIILPLLSSADAGFEHLVGNMVWYMGEHLMVTFTRIIFAIPVSLYLFGLVFGGIYGRNTDKIKVEELVETEKSMRKVPDVAICTVLLILNLVYVLFIGLQGSYLFSAFAKKLPAVFTYAEYARRGFFELCQIGVWNLILLWCAGVFSQSESRKHRGLRFLMMMLSVLTLLLLATAISKMGMYISVYGLTVRRILPLTFMIWMAIVFVAVMVRQKKEYAMIRFCVMAGAVLFCLLCVFPVEHWVEMYNVWARMRGWIV